MATVILSRATRLVKTFAGRYALKAQEPVPVGTSAGSSGQDLNLRPRVMSPAWRHSTRVGG